MKTFTPSRSLTWFKGSVRNKIFGMALLLLLLSGTVVLFMRLEIRAYTKRDSMRQMSVALLSAHRFERDFITTRDSAYIQRFQQSLERFDEHLSEHIEIEEQAESLARQAKGYTISFQNLAVALKQRGLSEKSGTEGAFRASVHAIEGLITKANQMQLLNTMLQVRRNEKDFLLRRQEKYIVSVQELIATLREQTRTASIDAASKETIDTLAGEYSSKFIALVTLLKRVDMLDTRLNNEFSAMNLVLDELVAAQERTALAYRSASLLVLLVSFVLCLVLAWRISRSIAQPIVQLNTAARRVASGDFETVLAVRTHDEIRDLADSFNSMVQNLRTSRDELHAEKQGVERKVQEATATIEAERTHLVQHVETLLEGIERFAEGDLTMRFAEHSTLADNNAMADLYRGFNHALENVRHLLLSTHEAVVEAAQAGVIISEKAEHFAQGAQMQSQQATVAAQSVEEMVRTINHTLDFINLAALNSTHAGDNARKGVETVEHTANGINAIVTATQQMERQIVHLTERIGKIDEIAGTIREIADLTNLLSLNASIEAARAGEHGRGFAVVAGEVKKLADRTSEATKEITQTINGIHEEAKGANNVMTEARRSVSQGIELTQSITYMFEEILNDALQVSNAMSDIQAQSRSQRAMSEQVNANVQNITTVAADTETSIKHLAEIALELKASMAAVYESLQHFTLSAADVADHRTRFDGDVQNIAEKIFEPFRPNTSPNDNAEWSLGIAPDRAFEYRSELQSERKETRHLRQQSSAGRKPELRHIETRIESRLELKRSESKSLAAQNVLQHIALANVKTAESVL